ncbi:Hypothetical predicted protein [Podarcis lilfordi]|uniref:Uncharacterized protein n=1 Tax=Podarcis lilfordi TaxID=74358 RepID=A0AA35JWX1_9SAUR|nr:Hypothetical predicted protein [Podarcis lilfordi]
MSAKEVVGRKRLACRKKNAAKRQSAEVSDEEIEMRTRRNLGQRSCARSRMRQRGRKRRRGWRRRLVFPCLPPPPPARPPATRVLARAFGILRFLKTTAEQTTPRSASRQMWVIDSWPQITQFIHPALTIIWTHSLEIYST